MSDSPQTTPFAKTSLWLSVGCLITMTWIVYWPALDYGFVDYDDSLYVVNNPRVPQGLTSDNITWAMTTRSVSNWHPLLWLSYMLDIELFGMDGGGFHLTNLVFHTANTLLLLAFLYVTTGRVWLSAFASAMFAIHPLHVESVAWVSERKDVLFVFFGLLTLLAYVRFIRTDRWFWYSMSLVMFVMSLACKQMLVTMPFLLLLLDDWPLNRTPWRHRTDATEDETARPHVSWTRLIVEKVPFLLIALVLSVVAMSAQSINFPGLERYSMTVRIMNAILVYSLYLWKTLWPINMAAFYPHPLDEISRPATVISGLFLIAVTGAILTQWRKRPYLPVGWFWYLGTLVPVIGLVQVGVQQMADRYTYFPIIGALIAFTWWIASIAPRSWRAPYVAGPLAAVIIIAAMVVARQQVRVWKDTEALFTHALAVTEKNALAHYSLGMVRNREGRFDDAIRHFEQSTEIDPLNPYTYYNLGLAHYRQGKLNEATLDFRRALELRPTHISSLMTLGIAYRRMSRLEEAFKVLSRVVEVAPENANAHANFGMLMIDLNRPGAAIEHFRRTVQLTPNDGRAHFKLAALLHTRGDLDAAQASYVTALRIKPEHAEAHYRLGSLLSQKKELQPAVQHLQTAVRLKPGHQPAQQLLRTLSNR